MKLTSKESIFLKEIIKVSMTADGYQKEAIRLIESYLRDVSAKKRSIEQRPVWNVLFSRLGNDLTTERKKFEGYILADQKWQEFSKIVPQSVANMVANFPPNFQEAGKKVLEEFNAALAEFNPQLNTTQGQDSSYNPHKK